MVALGGKIWYPGASVKVQARLGDPFAQLLAMDTSRVGSIYPLIEQIRQRGRMSPVKRVGWVTADAQIVRQVLRDKRFRTMKLRDQSPLRVLRWILANTDPGFLSPLEPPSMLVTDPPEHTRLRHPVGRSFTPRALDRLRSRIHEVADGLLRDLGSRAECDLVAEYTSKIPIAVIADLMDIPSEETQRLHAIGKSTEKLIGSASLSWRDFCSATKAFREFDQYMPDIA